MQLWSNWPGFAALEDRLDALVNPDMEPVLLGLEVIIENDNRQGILAGLDKDGQPMKPTWRQSHPENQWVTRSAGGKKWKFLMIGSAEAGDGPPLAPKREASRVIDHFETAHAMTLSGGRDGEWVVMGAWRDVLSDKGVPFLPFHFRGEGRLPTRDLGGLRPAGRRAAYELVDQWSAAVAAGQAP